jgi:hypothetical protein
MLKSSQVSHAAIQTHLERKSKDDEDGVDDDPLPFEVVNGLSHDIRIFSMPRPASTRMSGVVERCCTDSG